MRTVLALGLAMATSAAASAAALAQESDGGEARFHRAQDEERAGAFALALADDRACAQAFPDSRYGAWAAERASWLERHAEGGFAPLARLERVRNDPALADSARELDALLDDAKAFPPGEVRAEARLFVASAWLGRMRRPREALDLLRAVAGDASADRATRVLAEHELVGALLDARQLASAEREARAHPDRIDATLAARLGRLRRSARIDAASLAMLGIVAAAAGTALVRAARRGVLPRALAAARALAPMAIAFGGYSALAGGGLASLYDGGHGAPFARLGATIVPLVLVARAWSAIGSDAAGARVGRALLCAAAAIAAAIVTAHQVDPTYLDGLGL
jgi:hypothetical protein